MAQVALVGVPVQRPALEGCGLEARKTLHEHQGRGLKWLVLFGGAGAVQLRAGTHRTQSRRDRHATRGQNSLTPEETERCPTTDGGTLPL